MPYSVISVPVNVRPGACIIEVAEALLQLSKRLGVTTTSRFNGIPITASIGKTAAEICSEYKDEIGRHQNMMKK